MPPPIQPAANPFSESAVVAGAGMVEPETENISIGAPAAGHRSGSVRESRPASEGWRLRCFASTIASTKRELAVRQAMLADATATLERLEAMPRPEEMPAAEAKIREAKADWENWEQQWARGEKLVTDRTMTEEEFQERKQTAIGARERYNKAVADYNLLKAGTWEPESESPRRRSSEKAQVEQAQTELDRLTVKALVDGEVLQVNVRPGEFVGRRPARRSSCSAARRSSTCASISTSTTSRGSCPNAPAKATLKGQSKDFFPLRFVRIEPYVIPKKSLTGDNTERVDTRVLQVIYAVDATNKPLFVGQQVDVFIDASPPEVASKTTLK